MTAPMAALQCVVAVCCSVLQCVDVRCMSAEHLGEDSIAPMAALQCAVAVRCSVLLQCVAVRCGVLQCITRAAGFG